MEPDDDSDDVTLLEFILNIKEKRKQEEDDKTLADILKEAKQAEGTMQQSLKQQKKEARRKTKKRRTRCKKKARKKTAVQEADKKWRQRQAKRTSYMEELGEVAGNRLYLDDMKRAKAKQREKSKKKEQQKKKDHHKKG